LHVEWVGGATLTWMEYCTWGTALKVMQEYRLPVPGPGAAFRNRGTTLQWGTGLGQGHHKHGTPPWPQAPADAPAIARENAATGGGGVDLQLSLTPTGVRVVSVDPVYTASVVSRAAKEVFKLPWVDTCSHRTTPNPNPTVAS
jgi:hypothetical protein